MPGLSSKQSKGFKLLSWAVGILIVSLSITIYLLGERKAALRHEVFNETLQRKVIASRLEFFELFRPVSQTLKIVQRWGTSGMLDYGGTGNLNALFKPVLEMSPQIEYLSITANETEKYILSRGKEGLTNKQLVSDDQWPLNSHWYKNALLQSSPDDLNWSSLLAAAPDAEAGITATVTWKGPINEGRIFVGAAHVSRERLNQLAARVPITKNGILILLDRDQSIMWLSANQGLLDRNAPEYRVVNSGISIWSESEKKRHVPFNFYHEDTEWWGAFYHLSTQDKTSELGVFIPARILDKRLKGVSDLLIYTLFLMIFMAIILVAKLAYDYKKNLSRIIKKNRHKISSGQQLNELINEGENEYMEFKSTLRWNLKAGKAGKEIELAWLKSVVAFINGEGGNILIGVQDDGVILGLESDGFVNDDKMLLHLNNLINRHIGLEFAKYIIPMIKKIGHHQILVISCEPASEPAYLKNNEDESFYIRAGPSSRKLPSSKIVEYIKKRKIWAT